MSTSVEIPARSAGDFDYDARGHGYARHRRTDPRIAAIIHQHLGPGRSVLNVGAGAGSYEPEDRHVIAVEPSATMRAQRPAHLTPAIHGVAENLPLDDQSVDMSMAMMTVHQWPDLKKGLSELKRVTRGRILILTFDGDWMDRFWLHDYIPELTAAERRRFPAIGTLREAIGSQTEAVTIPIPADCVDGFAEAFYARPERFLDPTVRGAQSAWGFVTEEAQLRCVEELGRDLQSGAWDEKYSRWRAMPYYDGSLRLVVSHPEGRKGAKTR